MTFYQIDWTDEHKFSPERWTWIELLSDFNIPIGIHLNISEQYNTTKVWECKKGDVIAVSIGEYQDYDQTIRSCMWGVYNGEFQACPGLSVEFITMNELQKNGKLFADVTLNIKRLQKLNQLV